MNMIKNIKDKISDIDDVEVIDILFKIQMVLGCVFFILLVIGFVMKIVSGNVDTVNHVNHEMTYGYRIGLDGKPGLGMGFGGINYIRF